MELSLGLPSKLVDSTYFDSLYSKLPFKKEGKGGAKISQFIWNMLSWQATDKFHFEIRPLLGAKTEQITKKKKKMYRVVTLTSML